jgi:hypothetical protein
MFATLALLLAALPQSPRLDELPEPCVRQHIVPRAGSELAEFGTRVAIDERWLAIGEPYFSPSASATSIGRVEVYEIAGRNAFLSASLEYPGDTPASVDFGYALGIEDSVLVVGAYRDDVNGLDLAGSVFVYEHESGAWTLVSHLTAPAPQLYGRFGLRVATDGTTIAVQALRETDVVGSEVVYLFERGDAGWTLVQSLRPQVDEGDDGFGDALAIDDATLFVGAPRADDVPFVSGTLYVFQRQGGSWSQTQRLLSSDLEPANYFGESIALDEDRALVGARGKATSTGAGAVYVFERAADGSWAESQRVDGIAGVPGTFGVSLDLDADRAVATQSDLSMREPGIGVVLEFGPDGRLAHSALAPPPGGNDKSLYPGSIALENSTLAVSAPRDSVDGQYTGSVWLLSLDGELCKSLRGAPEVLSLASGGTQTLSIQAGKAVGRRMYVVLGSASGSLTGFAFGAERVPLDVDGYLLATLLDPASTPLVGSIGFLDASGHASPAFALPAGSDPAVAGLELHHAAIVLGPGLAPLHVSNAVRLMLRP